MITLYGTGADEYAKFTINKSAFKRVIENIKFLYSNNIDFMLKSIL
jgi:hypothetical protein